MRLWSLHPKYLDARGLVALWREALLAQKVLQGKTKGYRRHPQLLRFRAAHGPERCMARYLQGVLAEAHKRGYAFNRKKITPHKNTAERLKVTAGQLAFELRHLLRKLKKREPRRYALLRGATRVQAHPLFRKIKGPVEFWEKG